ncbi:MAG: hypothetical protein AAF264_13020 [Pseudomonadota bacterium]
MADAQDKKDDGAKKGGDKPLSKEERLAQALRDNLRRRKAKKD